MDWTFKQLGGEGKTFKLAGGDAPHGRPRQKPVVKDGVRIRNSTTYYTGNNRPTRHVYGHKFEPWELEGRFMDIFGGQGYARAKADEAKVFVDDQQLVLVTWGPYIACEGFIEWIELGREGAGNIAWKMSVQIDDDLILSTQKKTKAPVPDSIKDLSRALEDALDKALGGKRSGKSITKFPPTLDIGISDFLDSFVSAINTPAAAFNNLVNQVGDLATASTGDLRRLRAGVHQIKTGVLNLQTVYEDLKTDAAIQSSYAAATTDFDSYRLTSAAAMNEAASQIRKIDRATAIAERGSVKAFYTAKNGDTWESIATTFYGSASRAADIQKANSESGPPVPSVLYVIPV